MPVRIPHTNFVTVRKLQMANFNQWSITDWWMLAVTRCSTIVPLLAKSWFAQKWTARFERQNFFEIITKRTATQNRSSLYTWCGKNRMIPLSRFFPFTLVTFKSPVFQNFESISVCTCEAQDRDRIRVTPLTRSLLLTKFKLHRKTYIKTSNSQKELSVAVVSEPGRCCVPNLALMNPRSKKFLLKSQDFEAFVGGSSRT